jgi:hypothetical protein
LKSKEISTINNLTSQLKEAASNHLRWWRAARLHRMLRLEDSQEENCMDCNA